MEFNFVLTGTIIPQSNYSVGQADVRRIQYIDAIKYYAKLGKVYFLENSMYDFSEDNDFNIQNLTIVKFENNLDHFDLGKGYQEFKMLDQFVLDNRCPNRFIKITGRYLVLNIVKFNKHYYSDRQYIDLSPRLKTCDTFFFIVSKDFYLKNISGLFVEADDSKEIWIEKVLFQKFSKTNAIYPFYIHPVISAISGSTGNVVGGKKWSAIMKIILRKVSFILKLNNRLW